MFLRLFGRPRREEPWPSRLPRWLERWGFTPDHFRQGVQGCAATALYMAVFSNRPVWSSLQHGGVANPQLIPVWMMLAMLIRNANGFSPARTTSEMFVGGCIGCGLALLSTAVVIWMCGRDDVGTLRAAVTFLVTTPVLFAVSMHRYSKASNLWFGLCLALFYGSCVSSTYHQPLHRIHIYPVYQCYYLAIASFFSFVGSYLFLPTPLGRTSRRSAARGLRLAGKVIDDIVRVETGPLDPETGALLDAKNLPTARPPAGPAGKAREADGSDDDKGVGTQSAGGDAQAWGGRPGGGLSASGRGDRPGDIDGLSASGWGDRPGDGLPAAKRGAASVDGASPIQNSPFLQPVRAIDTHRTSSIAVDAPRTDATGRVGEKLDASPGGGGAHRGGDAATLEDSEPGTLDAWGDEEASRTTSGGEGGAESATAPGMGRAKVVTAPEMGRAGAAPRSSADDLASGDDASPSSQFIAPSILSPPHPVPLASASSRSLLRSRRATLPFHDEPPPDLQAALIAIHADATAGVYAFADAQAQADSARLEVDVYSPTPVFDLEVVLKLLMIGRDLMATIASGAGAAQGGNIAARALRARRRALRGVSSSLKAALDAAADVVALGLPIMPGLEALHRAAVGLDALVSEATGEGIASLEHDDEDDDDGDGGGGGGRADGGAELGTTPPAAGRRAEDAAAPAGGSRTVALQPADILALRLVITSLCMAAMRVVQLYRVLPAVVDAFDPDAAALVAAALDAMPDVGLLPGGGIASARRRRERGEAAGGGGKLEGGGSGGRGGGGVIRQSLRLNSTGLGGRQAGFVPRVSLSRFVPEEGRGARSDSESSRAIGRPGERDELRGASDEEAGEDDATLAEAPAASYDDLRRVALEQDEDLSRRRRSVFRRSLEMGMLGNAISDLDADGADVASRRTALRRGSLASAHREDPPSHRGIRRDSVASAPQGGAPRARRRRGGPARASKAERRRGDSDASGTADDEEEGGGRGGERDPLMALARASVMALESPRRAGDEVDAARDARGGRSGRHARDAHPRPVGGSPGPRPPGAHSDSESGSAVHGRASSRAYGDRGLGRPRRGEGRGTAESAAVRVGFEESSWSRSTLPRARPRSRTEVRRRSDDAWSTAEIAPREPAADAALATAGVPTGVGQRRPSGAGRQPGGGAATATDGSAPPVDATSSAADPLAGAASASLAVRAVLSPFPAVRRFSAPSMGYGPRGDSGAEGEAPGPLPNLDMSLMRHSGGPDRGNDDRCTKRCSRRIRKRSTTTAGVARGAAGPSAPARNGEPRRLQTAGDEAPSDSRRRRRGVASGGAPSVLQRRQRGEADRAATGRTPATSPLAAPTQGGDGIPSAGKGGSTSASASAAPGRPLFCTPVGSPPEGSLPQTPTGRSPPSRSPFVRPDALLRGISTIVNRATMEEGADMDRTPSAGSSLSSVSSALDRRGADARATRAGQSKPGSRQASKLPSKPLASLLPKAGPARADIARAPQAPPPATSLPGSPRRASLAEQTPEADVEAAPTTSGAEAIAAAAAAMPQRPSQNEFLRSLRSFEFSMEDLGFHIEPEPAEDRGRRKKRHDRRARAGSSSSSPSSSRSRLGGFGSRSSSRSSSRSCSYESSSGSSSDSRLPVLSRRDLVLLHARLAPRAVVTATPTLRRKVWSRVLGRLGLGSSAVRLSIQLCVSYIFVMFLTVIEPIYHSFYEVASNQPDLERGYSVVWAMIAVMVCQEGNAGATVKKSWDRIAGTVAGLGTGLGVMYFAVLCNGFSFSNAAPRMVVSSIAMSITNGIISAFGARFRDHPYAYCVWGLTNSAVALAGYIDGSVQWKYGLYRAALTAVGGLVHIGVSLVVFPVPAADLYREGMAVVLAGSGNALASLLESMAPRREEGAPAEAPSAPKDGADAEGVAELDGVAGLDGSVAARLEAGQGGGAAARLEAGQGDGAAARLKAVGAPVTPAVASPLLPPAPNPGTEREASLDASVPSGRSGGAARLPGQARELVHEPTSFNRELPLPPPRPTVLRSPLYGPQLSAWHLLKAFAWQTGVPLDPSLIASDPRPIGPIFLELYSTFHAPSMRLSLMRKLLDPMGYEYAPYKVPHRAHMPSAAQAQRMARRVLNALVTFASTLDAFGTRKLDALDKLHAPLEDVCAQARATFGGFSACLRDEVEPRDAFQLIRELDAQTQRFFLLVALHVAKDKGREEKARSRAEDWGGLSEGRREEDVSAQHTVLVSFATLLVASAASVRRLAIELSKALWGPQSFVAGQAEDILGGDASLGLSDELAAIAREALEEELLVGNIGAAQGHRTRSTARAAVSATAAAADDEFGGADDWTKLLQRHHHVS